MIGSNQRNNNCFKYLEQRKVSTGVDYTRNGRAAKITVDDSEVTQRLTTARSHYYPQIGAQREIMLSEVRGQDHSAGLSCRQLEAQRRGKHCYRTEITWVERDGVIQFASFFLSSSYRFLPLSKQGRKPSGKGPCMCSLRANNPALVHIPLRGFRLLSKCSTKTPLCICNFQVKIEKYFKIA